MKTNLVIRVRRTCRKALSLLLVSEVLFLNVPSSLDAASAFRALVRHAQEWLAQALAAPSTQQTEVERSALVASVQVVPGDVEAAIGQHLFFSAIARDLSGQPVPGVSVEWEAHGDDNSQSLPISNGEFVVPSSGTFSVTATAAGQTSTATVTVPNTQIRPFDQTFNPGDGSGWNDDDQDAVTNPRNARGRPPYQYIPPPPGGMPVQLPPTDAPPPAPHDLPGSSNFEVSVPVVSLPGRGLNLNLSLYYNSQLWTYGGPVGSKNPKQLMIYNIDGDWPAPGWMLGFGKVVFYDPENDVVLSTPLLEDGDGTRHLLQNGHDSYNGEIAAWRQTTDGTLVDYEQHLDVASHFLWAQAKYPNGTVVDFGAASGGVAYATRITDANGNFISITYVDNSGPRLNSVTDTLGRTVQFAYDANQLLTAVVAPDFGGGTRQAIRLHYAHTAFAPGFRHAVNAVVGDNPPWGLDAIYYPTTSAGYWFGDADSYSDFGTLAKVEEQRGMQFTGGLNEMGSVRPGPFTHRRVYDYPMHAPPGGLVGPPIYAQLTETWDHMNTAPAITQFGTGTEDPTVLRVWTKYPNGTVVDQFSVASVNNGVDEWKVGLPYRQEVHQNDGTHDVLLTVINTTWELGDYGSGRRKRVETTDELGQTTAVEYSYGASPNLVTDVKEFDYGGYSLLRRTHTSYADTPDYADRHIFGLVSQVQRLSPTGAVLAQTQYTYDAQRGTALSNAPGAIQHLVTFNPFSLPYNSHTDFRGNLTGIRRYIDGSHWTDETRNFDILGNLVSFSASCCEQTSLLYTLNTQYAYPEAKTRGARDNNPSARITTSSTYDFNTGLTTSTTDANGRQRRTDYLPGSLRPKKVTLATQATTEFVYDDPNLTLTQTVKASTGELVAQVVSHLNGLGLLRRQENLAADNAWDAVEYQYDTMARAWQQSRPFRDAPSRWTFTNYDAMSRVTSVTGPGDVGTVQTFYNEPPGLHPRPSSATSLPGATVRTRDAWGREKWSRLDALGRLVEVVEPNPAGDGTVNAAGNQATLYFYNLLDKLTLVQQGAQVRQFDYDWLGRLVHQKLAEAQGTLDDGGRYVGHGTWSDVFNYDERSNLTSHIDARGIKTVHNYYNAALGTFDPLNRVQSLSYDASGFGDISHAITAAPGVTYEYATSGDVTRRTRVRIDGIVTSQYGYDGEGRLSSRTLTFDDWPSGMPLVTEYHDDSLGRLQDLRYPIEYGLGAGPGKLLHQDFGFQSQTTAISFDGSAVASSLVYNEAGQLTSLKVGAQGPMQTTEVYGYERDSGLLATQSVSGSGSLLDLGYQYGGPHGGKSGQLVSLQNNLNPDQSQQYTYDALGRLVGVSGGLLGEPHWWQQYGYDRYGNRTSSNAYDNLGGDASAAPSSSPASPSSQPWGASDVDEVSSSQRSVMEGCNSVPPPAPQNLRATNRTTSSFTLVWNYPLCPYAPNGSITSNGQPIDPIAPPQFVVEMKQSETGSYQVIGRVDYTSPPSLQYSFSLSNLTSNTNYFMQVRLEGTVLGPSPESNVLAVSTNAPPPAPRQLTASASLPQGVQLQWSYDGPPAIVEVERKLMTGGEYRLISTASQGQSTFIDGSAHFSSRYTYRVHAHIDGYGDSDYSNEASVQLPVIQDGVGSLTYDAASNRISSTPYSYDNAGNLTEGVDASGNIQRYQYDAAGQLASVMDASGNLLERYSYGAGRRRLVTTSASGDKTYQVWNKNAVLAEYVQPSGQAPAFQRSYLYFGNRLLATRSDVSGHLEVKYHHPDRLGTRVITDDTGEVSYQETLPFGTAAQVAGGSSAPDVLFTDYHRSFTGLDNAVNRHYAPAQARFLEVDPMGVGATTMSNPQSLNLYGYGKNDPINGTDPSGSIWIQIWYWFSVFGSTDGGQTWDYRGDYAVAGPGIDIPDGWLDSGGSNAGSSTGVSGGGGDGPSQDSPQKSEQSCGPGPKPGAGYVLTASGWQLSPNNGQANSTWAPWEIAQAVAGVAALTRAAWGLASSALGAFAGKEAGSNVQAGMRLYRIFGDEARALGRFYTSVNPNEVANFREAAGLYPQNTGRFVMEATLEDTTGVISGSAAAGPEGVGGGLPEIQVPNPETQLSVCRVSGANPPF